jgi:hypothetical protein
LLIKAHIAPHPGLAWRCWRSQPIGLIVFAIGVRICRF